MKKALALILTMVVLSTCICTIAFADYSEGKLYYTVSNNSVTITGCFGSDSELTVPAAIAGCPVNTIASGAFVGRSELKTVNLPDTIMVVEDGAFDSGITVNYNSNIGNDEQQTIDGQNTEEITKDTNSSAEQTVSDKVASDVSIAEAEEEGHPAEETDDEETASAVSEDIPMLIEENPTEEDAAREEEEKGNILPMLIIAVVIAVAAAVIPIEIKKRKK